MRSHRQTNRAIQIFVRDRLRLSQVRDRSRDSQHGLSPSSRVHSAREQMLRLKRRQRRFDDLGIKPGIRTKLYSSFLAEFDRIVDLRRDLFDGNGLSLVEPFLRRRE